MPKWVEVVLLGTGSAVPTETRWPPSILVRDWRGVAVLLDAGEAAQVRVRQAGVAPERIDAIAITHDHGDHVNGLPGLLQSMQVGGRRRPLTIIAPGSLSDLLDYLVEDWLSFKVTVRKAGDRGSMELRRGGGRVLSVSWFKTCHTEDSVGYKLVWAERPSIERGRLEELGLEPGPWVSDLIERGEASVGGVRVRLEDVSQPGGRLSLAYTGDTRPCESVLDAVRGVDLLIHDSTYSRSHGEEAASKGHSTSEQAAALARDAGVGLLVLTHISSRYKGFEALRLLHEARRVFPRTLLAWDGMRLRLALRTPPGVM
jgi:ribonuclease Z